MNREAQTPASPPAAQSVPARKVLAEQLRLIHAHLPRSLFTYVVAITLMALALAATVPPAWLALWWGVSVTVAAAQFRIAYRYLVAPETARAPETGLTRFRRDVLVAGLVLGAGAAGLAIRSDTLGQGMLLILLTGMMGGALPVLTGDLRAYRVFSVAAMLPFVGTLFWFARRGDTRAFWMAVMALLYLLFMLETAKRVHRTLVEALKLRFDKAALADEMRENNLRLERRLQFEHVVSELSSEFVHLPVERIDDGIQRALKTIGEFAGVDRAYVFVIRDDCTVDNTHEWCADGVTPQIGKLRDIRLADYPWFKERILAQQDVHVPQVAELPAEAGAERAEWEREQIQSLVIVPMALGDTVRGYLGFDAVRDTKFWTHDDIALLRLAGENFINALERRRAESQLYRQARYDDLTGLPNRRLFMEYLSRAMSFGRRRNVLGAVLFVDLDRFKPINDSLGHGAGDIVLREVGRRLPRQVREYDVIARLGGDEFAVLLPQLAADAPRAEHEAWSVAEKIRAAVALPLRVGGQALGVTASVGIALFPRDAETAEEALEHADVAMYQAKAAGRDAQRFFAVETKNATMNRLRLHTELRAAIQRDELELFLQPQVDGNRRLIGAEGLLRWRHPERGLLGAEEFIPLAEDTGLIAELDAWALRAACRVLGEYRERLGREKDFRFALNVSPATFQDADFVRRTARIIEECRIPPGWLEFEVTERLFMLQNNVAMAKLAALRDVGIRMSIDDFGVGYSSLAYLKHLPIHRVKVDKSFVQGVHANRNDSAIVEAIMGVAASFGYQVIAEGVEQERDFDFLRLLGVWIFQGYLFGRPMPGREFARLLPSAAPPAAVVTGASG